MLNKKSVNIRITIPKLLPLIIAGLILVFTCGEALAGRCSSCGKIIDDSSVFCMYCGVKVSEKSVSLFDIKKARRGGELINAAARGDLRGIKSLVDSGVDMETRDFKGDTALAKAAEKGDLDVIKYLCEKGAMVDSLNGRNQTPLMSACERGNYKAAEYLISRGANMDQAALGNSGERTPLMQAAYNGHSDIVKLLLEKGAKPDYVNIKGETALSLARAKFNMKAAALIEDSLKSLEAKSDKTINTDSINSVYEKGGAIYLSYSNGESEKITEAENFKYPALSPDKRYLCFVRTFPQVTIGMDCGDIEVGDIYMIDLAGTAKPYMVLKGSREHLKNVYEINAGINSLQFSSDGTKIYFMCAALLSNSAIKVIDLRSKEVKFLTGGKSLKVIYQEKYKDHFISLQRKYTGANYPRDVYCLMSPFGEEIREISSEPADVEKEFFSPGD